MRTRVTVAVVATLAVLAGAGLYLGSRHLNVTLPLSIAAQRCEVRAEQQTDAQQLVRLSPAQMANAATITAVGVRRRMPERAVVVALATAYQESHLENLAGGDRDSLGLFQQRPSKGWGTPEQIQDPVYAANKFYAALKKVRGWEEMRVTDAAQAVQRSAFPEAYEKWADEATVLTRALLGDVTGAVACTVGRTPTLRGGAAATALTEGLTRDWGKVDAVSVDALTGLAVAATDTRTGWRYAHWLVSHARDNGVRSVRFGDLQWTADDGEWSRIKGDAARDDRVIAEVFAEK